ncbi:MAG: hypothetical protein IH941_08465 [Acidobacteria bacterium]|nr:hypothetical protein [Acidobacteriota bacterium]
MTARLAPVNARVNRRGREFHVVIGPGTRRRGRRRYWVLLVAALTAAFLVSVYARIALDRSAFVVTDIERQITVEEARYWDLRLQVTELQAPERISSLALEMGMVYPEIVRTIEVPGLGESGPGVEERWIDLKALLGAQP